MPKVSVIVAAFNAGELIRDSLTSLQNQTLSDWEAIVVDDASTDDTSSIVRTFLNDPRITLVTLPRNGGSGAARNRALSLCRSPLIAVLDADDICQPERLEIQVNRFESDRSLDIVGSQVLEFGSWGGPETGTWPTSKSDIEYRVKRSKMPVAHCTMIIKAEVIRSVGGYDEQCLRAQDFALLRKLRTAKIYVESAPLVLYRTIRPIPLSYVISSGRYGHLARIKTRQKFPRPNASVGHFPQTAFIDARSMITWLRRLINERARARTHK